MTPLAQTSRGTPLKLSLADTRVPNSASLPSHTSLPTQQAQTVTSKAACHNASTYKFTSYVTRAGFASTYDDITSRRATLNAQSTVKSTKKSSEDIHTDLFWDVYKLIVKRVVETVKIYLRSDLKHRETIHENSRFAYIKKEMDQMSEDKQEDMLEYLISLDTLYGTTHRSQITAFLKDRHEGPKMLEIMLHFLDDQNPDFLYFIDEKSDEKGLGQMVEKKNIVEEKTRKELTGNIELFRSYFQHIQEGRIRGL